MTIYINTDAEPGGDGTTPALSSDDGTHAYNSIPVLEAVEK